MRVSLFTFVITSLLTLSSCSDSGGEGAAITPEEGGATGGDDAADGGGDDADNADDAAPIDNQIVKDKPLLKSCYKGDTFSCRVESIVVAESNKARGTRRALLHAYESSYVARDWSIKQATVEGSVSHDGFPYERKKVLNADFPNAQWTFSAENVAVLANRDGSAEAVAKQLIDMWKNSEGHLRNIVGNHSYIGVGVVRVGSSVYATQLFH